MYLQDKALQTLLNDDLVPDSTTILWSLTGFDADGDTTGVCAQSGCRGREAMSCSTSAATCERGGNIGPRRYSPTARVPPDCVDSMGNAIAVWMRRVQCLRSAELRPSGPIADVPHAVPRRFIVPQRL